MFRNMTCSSLTAIIFAGVILTISGCDTQNAMDSLDKKIALQPVGKFVTVLKAANSKEPVFIASVDPADNIVKIKNISAIPVKGKSFELWWSDPEKDPSSLGLIDRKSEIALAQPKGIDPDKLHNITLAVSVEPFGGSRTGKPTGPVLYTGKLEPAVKKQEY